MQHSNCQLLGFLFTREYFTRFLCEKLRGFSAGPYIKGSHIGVSHNGKKTLRRGKRAYLARWKTKYLIMPTQYYSCLEKIMKLLTVKTPHVKSVWASACGRLLILVVVTVGATFSKGVYASDTAATTPKQLVKIRPISPDSALLVTKSQPVIVYRNPTVGLGYTLGSNTSEVTCCTNWSRNTGGSGCATLEDYCPSNQFEIDCGTMGCR